MTAVLIDLNQERVCFSEELAKCTGKGRRFVHISLNMSNNTCLHGHKEITQYVTRHNRYRIPHTFLHMNIFTATRLQTHVSFPSLLKAGYEDTITRKCKEFLRN